MYRDDGGPAGARVSRRALLGVLCGDRRWSAWRAATTTTPPPATTVAAGHGHRRGGGAAPATTGAGAAAVRQGGVLRRLHGRQHGRRGGRRSRRRSGGGRHGAAGAGQAGRRPAAPPELADDLATATGSCSRRSTTKDGSAHRAGRPGGDQRVGGRQLRVDEGRRDRRGLPLHGHPRHAYAAGDYEFDLTNTGKEFHVLVIVARKPGVRTVRPAAAGPAGESQGDDAARRGGASGRAGRRRAARARRVPRAVPDPDRHRRATPRAPARPTSPPACSRP